MKKEPKQTPPVAEPAAEPAAPYANIYSRVIAAGINDDQRTLKLTLLLTPLPRGKTDAQPGDVNLSTWPKAVLEQLLDQTQNPADTVKLVVQDVRSQGTAIERPRRDGARSVWAKIRSLGLAYDGAKDGETNRRIITDLWQKTFSPPLTDLKVEGPGAAPWIGLSEGLLASLLSEKYRAGTIANAASAVDTIDDVRSIRQGDLAITLDLMRAREVAATVAEAFGVAGARQALEDKVRENTKPGEEAPDPSESGEVPTELQKEPDEAAQEDAKKTAIEKARQEELERVKARTQHNKDTSKTFFTEWGKVFLPSACSDEPMLTGLSSNLPAGDLATADAGKLHAEMDAPLASHVYGTNHEPKPADTGGKLNLAEWWRDTSSRRFFALQSSPSLARLFGLAVDLEVSIEDFLPAAGAGDISFHFLSVEFGASREILAARGVPYTWTLAKLDRHDATPFFWPANRSELDLSELACTTLDPADLYTQYNGVLVLGQGWNTNPRFELTSLDVRSAAETQEQRNRERRMLPAGTTSDELKARPIERQTLHTAGLTLLDRGRRAATTAKLAVREAQRAAIGQAINDALSGEDGTEVLLDAEELTVGYRPDIGLRVGDGYEWRGLMNREVRYGTSGWHSNTVPTLLDRLTGEVGDPGRTMLDSALVATPTRLMKDPGGTDSTEAIVEEIVTTWDGGPMGIDCSGPDALKTVEDDLPIGRVIALPDTPVDSEHLLRLPRLRLGWPYRLGFRAVYMGGSSPTVLEAKEAYNGDLGGHLAFPPRHDPRARSGNHRREQRRFLRHERIDAPSLLLPADLAVKGDKLMGFERSPEAIVRTYVGPSHHPSEEGDALARATPERTQRIFVPPRVPQAFAALHGVFDDDDQSSPKQGLQGVRHDGNSQANRDGDNTGQSGGFPIAVPVELHGLDQVLFADKREIRSEGDNSGDPVFETQVDWLKRRVGRFYPDPAARYYVLALRFAGTNTYLNGDPIVVPLYENDAPDYPNVLPLSVTITAIAEKRAAGAPTQGDLIESGPEPISIDPSKTGRRVKVQPVNIELFSGEDFELDVWCASDAKSLAKLFAVIETLGVIAKTSSKKKLLGAIVDLFEGVTESDPTFLQGLKRAQGWLDTIAGPSSGFSGVGGLETPDPRELLAVAELVDTAMRRRPVDELAAKQTLRVTHAVNRPQFVPEWGDNVRPHPAWVTLPPAPIPGIHQLRIARPARDAAAALRQQSGPARYETFFNEKKPLIEEGSSDFILGGSILVDLDTTDSFEIEALTTYPRSPGIDDKAKRRSQADRRQGLWPVVTDLTSGKTQVSATSDIYGFHVDFEGNVELPRTRVTLMRVDHLKSPRQTGMQERRGELEILDLEEFYGLEASPDGNYPKVKADAPPEPVVPDDNAPPKQESPDDKGGGLAPPNRIAGAKLALPHAFADGKARRLTLTIAALSRFAHSWTTAARRDKDKFFKRGEPLQGDSGISRSAPIDIWLPSTIRPTKPSTRSPLPAFIWNTPAPETDGNRTTTYWIERRAVTRVPLRREWFSSGEEEKLGVVVWPPDLFDLNAPLLEANKLDVPVYGNKVAGDKPTASRPVDLSDFEDSDLGPGGFFVSRWGGDPIRDGAPQKGVFIPPSAFADKYSGQAKLVPNVAMPIGSALPGVNDKEQVEDWLTVSLLAYTPRFDIGREEWYVDLDIVPADATDPFVRLGLVRYQEHAPPELQVSQPVVEWTQLLPARTMEVTVVDSGDRLKVDVKLTGQASTGAAHSPVGDTATEALNSRPVMNVSLWFEGWDSAGRQVRELLAETLSNPTDDPKIVGKSADGISAWCADLKAVPRSLLRQLGLGQLYVYAEEIERRRPATYAEEPLSLDEIFGKDEAGKARDRFVESGPRFAARLDIAGAEMAAPVK